MRTLGAVIVALALGAVALGCGDNLEPPTPDAGVVALPPSEMVPDECLGPDCAVRSCADLGCPDAPSGSPVAWEPCDGERCYCGSPPRACAR